MLTEHHLKENEIDMISIKNYSLGVKYCREVSKNGGCMYLYS
jgi:hypothetical protein